jgi:hypothetical protein
MKNEEKERHMAKLWEQAMGIQIDLMDDEATTQAIEIARPLHTQMNGRSIEEKLAYVLCMAVGLVFLEAIQEEPHLDPADPEGKF